MNIAQSQASQVIVVASNQNVQPCDECGFEDMLTYVTPEGDLPSNVCTFCVKNFPQQYRN